MLKVTTYTLKQEMIHLKLAFFFFLNYSILHWTINVSNDKSQKIMFYFIQFSHISYVTY